MKILFYGRLAEAIGAEAELDVPAGSSIARVREQLASEYPRAAGVLTSRRALTCVDGTLVRDDYLVRPTDRIEFLPPVSGG
jgi:molybdopterin converting factor small subunit